MTTNNATNTATDTATSGVDTTTPTGARRARYVGAAAAMLAVGGATACGGEDLTERFIENRIEAESGEKVDLDLSGGNIRIETDEGVFEMNADGQGNVSIKGDGTDGSFSIDSDDGVTVIESDEGTAVIDSGGSGVPDSFPRSVPLPDGFVPQMSQSVSTGDGDGWVLGGEMSSTVADLAATYFPRLEAAGFARVHLTETADSVIFNFDDGEYSVSGLAGDNGSGATYVNLTVADSQQ